MSHLIGWGEISARIKLRTGLQRFIFAKDGPHDVSFGWTKYLCTNIRCVQLEIQYPKTSRPCGSFLIIGAYVQ
jgi:hypothetical protein